MRDNYLELEISNEILNARKISKQHVFVSLLDKSKSHIFIFLINETGCITYSEQADAYKHMSSSILLLPCFSLQQTQ